MWPRPPSASAILVGDMIPFLLGRIFGVRLLRLRWLRYFITKQRLVTFDRWFRRRGDMVIVISRFLAGLRMVAFFTAGAMKMRWSRFLLLDGLGIILIAPLLTWLGFSSAGFIEDMIERIEKVERGLLWGVIGGTLLLAAGLWLQRRRRQQKRRGQMTEEFVQPQKRISEAEDAGGQAAATNSETLNSNELILEARPDAQRASVRRGKRAKNKARQGRSHRGKRQARKSSGEPTIRALVLDRPWQLSCWPTFAPVNRSPLVSLLCI